MPLNGKNLTFTTETIIDNRIGDIKLVKKIQGSKVRFIINN